MLDEEAKAVQEAAKAAGKALDLVGDAGKTINVVFGDVFKQFGGAVSDWARYFRLKNFLSVMDKTHELIVSRRLAGKPIPLPPQFALPVIEGASLETENDIQQLWAVLIVNATDPNKQLQLKKIYIEILRGLQPLDAHLITLLSRPGLDNEYGAHTGLTLNAQQLALLLRADVEDIQVSLQTLARYSCVLDSWENTIHGLDSGYGGFRVNNPKSNFRLSDLGSRLNRATSTSR